MSLTFSLIKRMLLTALAYAMVAVFATFLATPTDSFFLVWLAAMYVLLPGFAAVSLLVIIWTVSSHGRAEIRTEPSDDVPLTGNFPSGVSMDGNIMVNGRDPSGKPFGLND